MGAPVCGVSYAVEPDTSSFAVTFDYRCPFARNFCEHVGVALRAGAPWEVTLVPFFLDQAHVEEGEPDAWDRIELHAKARALALSRLIAAEQPEHLWDAHLHLFAARHDEGRDLTDPDVLARTLEVAGIATPVAHDLVARAVAGDGLEDVRKAHESAVSSHAVFGVPTVIVKDAAVFVRVMHRPEGDAELARSTVERVLDLAVAHPELNEVKHTRVPR